MEEYPKLPDVSTKPKYLVAFMTVVKKSLRLVGRRKDD